MVNYPDNKISKELAFYRHDGIPHFHVLLYEFTDPGIFPLYWEFEVTNGLGYKKLGYHEDSEKGLVRHLAVMESAVSRNYVKIHKRGESELGAALAGSEVLRHLQAKENKKTISLMFDEVHKNNKIILEELKKMNSRGRSYFDSPTPKSEETATKGTHPPKKRFIQRLLGR